MSFKKVFPHLLFVVFATAAFFVAAYLDAHREYKGGGFFRIDNLYVLLCAFSLAIYGAVTFALALLMRVKLGEWRVGTAYLLAIVVAPLLCYLTVTIHQVMDEVYSCVGEGGFLECVFYRLSAL